MARNVSVVIPMCNAEPIISETIESRLNRTLQHEYEILVVNNNAQTETVAAVRPYLAWYPSKIG